MRRLPYRSFRPLSPSACFGLLGLGLTLLLFTACDPALLLGPQASNASKYQLRASYYRGACYGRCEVFRLDVYDNGLLLFKGERFTERPGLWQKNVDRRRVTGLLDSMERADFENYPRAFVSQIADAPSTEVTYYDAAGRAYQTSFKENAPAELEAISAALRRLAELPDYRQVSDSIPGLQLLPQANQAREEIIVQLREGVEAASWVIAYGKQNVELKQRLAPNSPYYLITADPNIMGTEELLNFLRQDQAVLSAQKNQPVGPR